jgi:hypothetical protein
MKTCKRCKNLFSPTLGIEPYCPQCRQSMEDESFNSESESDSRGTGVLDMLHSMLSSIADAFGGSSDSGSSSSDSGSSYDGGGGYDSGSSSSDSGSSYDGGGGYDSGSSSSE